MNKTICTSKNASYYTIEYWMITDLDLTGRALQASALIQSLSGKGAVFQCRSMRYLARWLNADKNTAARALKQLLDRDLIVPVEGPEGPGYRTRRRLEEDHAAGKRKQRPRAASVAAPQNDWNDWLLQQARATELRMGRAEE